jgi:glutathione peroxidase
VQRKYDNMDRNIEKEIILKKTLLGLLLILSLNAGDTMKQFYDFNVATITRNEQSMSIYKDKVLLIVNVASECGFTPQYEGLEKLYKTYHDQGFEVLAFPCNQFGGQEPGSEKQILNFCRTKFDVTFPLFAKIDVNGKDTHPLYAYLKKKAPGVLGTESIKWNFTKFLIDREGNVITRYGSSTKPEEIAKDIEKLLK